MHLMSQLFVVILAIVAVSCHGYGNSHGHHSGGDDYSGPSRSVVAARSFGSSVGRSSSGWGSGTDARSYQSNDHSNDFLRRSNCGSDNYGFGGVDSSFRSTW